VTTSSSVDRIVVVGAGLAAAKAVECLRDSGYENGLTVVGRERHLPYERPPLSKDYLRGESERDTVFPLDAAWYTDHDVELVTGVTAVAMDRVAQEITLDDGRSLAYSKLLLATGSSPRVLDTPGADLDGVHTLRTLDDCELLRSALREASAGAGRLVIVGDGWIGLEVAASARQMGVEASVIGLGTYPLERVLGATLGEFYGQIHAQHGVYLHRRAHARAITGSAGRATGVEMADGTRVPADMVLIAVGAAPNITLAEAAGLAIDSATGGVVVGVTLGASDPHVFAAGDIASVPSARYGRNLRVEHWATAQDQGVHAGRAMLGSPEPYRKLPYFYSDQYDVGMEYLGSVVSPDEYELVVSGSLADQAFVAFFVRDGHVEAGMTVNIWDQMERVEELIRREGPIDRSELEGFAQ
jgi:3-phenylpropionate/trans-cinnamate dioxygenase ferredoxin reductase component